MTQINISLEADANPYGFLDALSQTAVRQLNVAIDTRIRQEYDALLRLAASITPPARTASSPPFVWSTDPAKNARARRWFFANYPNGYTRTGDLAKRFEIAVSVYNEKIAISIKNSSDAASYVYGSEEYNQVPGHAATGWPRIDNVAVAVGAQIEKDLEEIWAEVVRKA